MKPKLKILLAEDEPSLGLIIKESIETRGYMVTLCQDGVETLNTYHSLQPDVLVLDVMMPKKDGFAVAQEIRAQDKITPILFLTAKSQTKDVIEGFTLGGNDYLKKPFSMEELLVRIQNLVRQKNNDLQQNNMSIGYYTFRYKKQELQFNDEDPQQLTHREAQLLFHLIANKNELLDRSVILKKLWGDDDFFNARSMDVFITKLRKKLKKDDRIKIVNVRGYGYKLIY